MGSVHSVGLNKAIVVSGGCTSGERKMVVGGWVWAWWMISDVQTLSLELMTLEPVCKDVETAQGVPITVTGVAEVKMMSDNDDLLRTAAEQFLGKGEQEIEDTIIQTLEGHLRAILGTLTVEEVYKDREQFAALVRDVASPDVGKMGVEILSFTIKDVHDDVDYLESLGKSQTASVKRDAEIGVAQAERDAGIKEAECERETMDKKYQADTKIESDSRNLQLETATFNKEVNAALANASLAYELQVAKIQQKISSEEVQIDVAIRRKEIEIEDREIQRKEKELVSTVKLPAEAESYKVQVLAEGKRTQTVQTARAVAEKTRLKGKAEARALAAVGEAEATKMRLKANAYQRYGSAAITAQVLEKLPTIAAEVAAPLAKTGDIVLLGGTQTTTQEVNKLVSQIPPSIAALTGVDISNVVSGLSSDGIKI